MGSYSGQWDSPKPAVRGRQFLSDDEAIDRAGSQQRLNRSMAVRLGEGFFDNPVQMMLLELFIARIEQRETTVKVLAASSGVPASTAQRWIDRMEAQRLINKQSNGGDRRSIFVTIDDQAFANVRSLLAKL